MRRRHAYLVRIGPEPGRNFGPNYCCSATKPHSRNSNLKPEEVKYVVFTSLLAPGCLPILLTAQKIFKVWSRDCVCGFVEPKFSRGSRDNPFEPQMTNQHLSFPYNQIVNFAISVFIKNAHGVEWLNEYGRGRLRQVTTSPMENPPRTYRLSQDFDGHNTHRPAKRTMTTSPYSWITGGQPRIAHLGLISRGEYTRYQSCAK